MKNIYLESPATHYNEEKFDWQRSVFLAGSITGAHNWQKAVAKKLLENFSVFNPRREEFDICNLEEEKCQIKWEHFYLTNAEIVLFFFSHETFAPITLLEYGAALESIKTRKFQKIYVGIHPDYKRKDNVIIQTEIRNPEVCRNVIITENPINITELILKDFK